MPFFKFWKCVLFGIVEYFQIMDCLKVCLCSKMRPRFEFGISAKIENLQLFRKHGENYK